jgi:hypothetical protein
LPKEDQIDAGKELLSKSWFDEEKCHPGITALEAYRREFDADKGIYRDTPRHDVNSDHADAFLTAGVIIKEVAANGGPFTPRRPVPSHVRRRAA